MDGVIINSAFDCSPKFYYHHSVCLLICAALYFWLPLSTIAADQLAIFMLKQKLLAAPIDHSSRSTGYLEPASSCV
jgi:hypothetical protein